MGGGFFMIKSLFFFSEFFFFLPWNLFKIKLSSMSYLLRPKSQEVGVRGSLCLTLPSHLPPPPPPHPPAPAVRYRRRKNGFPTPPTSHPLVVRAQGYQRFPLFKPGVSQNIALYAAPADRTSTYLVSASSSRLRRLIIIYTSQPAANSV